MIWVTMDGSIRQLKIPDDPKKSAAVWIIQNTFYATLELYIVPGLLANNSVDWICSWCANMQPGWYKMLVNGI